MQVADGLLLLGNAHLSCRDYKKAIGVFHSALKIYRTWHGRWSVTAAKALDRIGYTTCRHSWTAANLDKARNALDEAFRIRYETMGPLHPDTVETLNNLAGVYLHSGNHKEAYEAYYEIMMARKAVFGPDHPGVAAASHALGNVCIKLAQLRKASACFVEASRIYRMLQVKPENPTMQKLSRDVAALNRILVHIQR